MTEPTTPRDASPDWDTLARFFAGESPADEARAVTEWLAEHPADADLLQRLDEVGRAGTAAADVDVEGALRRVKARRAAEAGPSVAPPADVIPVRESERKRPAPAWRSRWAVGGLAAAAALAALVLGRGRPGADRASSGSAPVATGEQTYTTPVGARDSVRLPDGTRVVLAPASRLVVAPGYGDRARNVTLAEGAAWFSVQHDEARPFTVRAGNAVVRDLGTEFAVRADQGAAGGASVAVTVGRVALSRAVAGDRREALTLAAGDRGELRPDGELVAERGAVGADDVAWTRGRLVYRGAPLDVVRADLRRWYGVELQVPDSTLAARRLTATFEGDSVGGVLDVIALALGARVERAGNTATLRPAR